ncbi:GTP-binding protein, partial [Craurococcus roseus]|uniref:GTP-binding protein n=1 Tax=Craurococcus roseus TaxID=77585 RepID=UPI0031CF1E2F
MTGRRHALIGVLGHVDHGKTALVRALTGTDTDRLPEEKARGISIALGFARLEAPCGAEVELVDAPGHERFVRAMVAGATAVDSALLVVDAREGARAQTAEHAEVAALLGVCRGVVAVARRDLADAEQALAAAEGARALLARLGLGADWPVVETSAATGEGVAELAAALGGLAREETPGEGGEAWLPLDRAFALAGAGVVATGALRRGRLSVGDSVEVLPRGLRASVRGIHSHGRALERVGPGRRVAVALRGVERRDVAPGDALAAPGLGLAASALLDARVAVLASAPRALARGEPLRLLIGTREVGARLRPLGRDRVEPGEEAVAQLALDAPVAVPARERFVLRLPSPPAREGGGEVLDPSPLRRRLR